MTLASLHTSSVDALRSPGPGPAHPKHTVYDRGQAPVPPLLERDRMSATRMAA